MASVPAFLLAKVSQEAPDYSLVAELYLDNAKVPARRSMVYLDPGSPEERRYGLVLMTGGWTTDIDGNLQEQKWVFKERGLETVFARLDVGSIAESKQEEILSASMDKAQIGREVEDCEFTTGKAGQITVNLFKVVVQSEYIDPEYSPDPSGDADDEGENMAKDITHRAATVAGNAVSIGKQMQIVNWTPYEPDGKLFATFIFRYRSKEVLRKYDFPGFPPSTDLAKGPSRLDTSLRKITPLSALEKATPKNGVGKRLRSGKDYQIPPAKATTGEAAAKERSLNDVDGKEQETDEPSSTKRFRSGKDYEVPTPPAQKAADGLRAEQSTLTASESKKESGGDIIDLPE